MMKERKRKGQTKQSSDNKGNEVEVQKNPMVDRSSQMSSQHVKIVPNFAKRPKLSSKTKEISASKTEYSNIDKDLNEECHMESQTVVKLEEIRTDCKKMHQSSVSNDELGKEIDNSLMPNFSEKYKTNPKIAENLHVELIVEESNGENDQLQNSKLEEHNDTNLECLSDDKSRNVHDSISCSPLKNSLEEVMDVDREQESESTCIKMNSHMESLTTDEESNLVIVSKDLAVIKEDFSKNNLMSGIISLELDEKLGMKADEKERNDSSNKEGDYIKIDDNEKEMIDSKMYENTKMITNEKIVQENLAVSPDLIDNKCVISLESGVNQNSQTQSFSQASSESANQIDQTQVFLPLDVNGFDTEAKASQTVIKAQNLGNDVQNLVERDQSEFIGHESELTKHQAEESVKMEDFSHDSSEMEDSTNKKCCDKNTISGAVQKDTSRDFTSDKGSEDAKVPDMQTDIIQNMNFDLEDAEVSNRYISQRGKHPDEITDSQLCNIDWVEDFTLPERFERKGPVQKDGTVIVKGLIKELSSLNMMILRTKRELETARRNLHKAQAINEQH